MFEYESITIQVGSATVTLNPEAFEVWHYNSNWNNPKDIYLLGHHHYNPEDCELEEVLNHRNLTEQQKRLLVEMREGEEITIRIPNKRGQKIINTDIYEIVKLSK